MRYVLRDGKAASNHHMIIANHRVSHTRSMNKRNLGNLGAIFETKKMVPYLIRYQC
jgi:hypothetical protein